jgi:hypothetical protein
VSGTTVEANLESGFLVFQVDAVLDHEVAVIDWL